MILNSEALEIIAFLKSAQGKYVSMGEISRRAGGRRKYEENPRWARNLTAPLLEAGLIEVNPRGHYRIKSGTPATPQAPGKLATPALPKLQGKVLGEDYFPTGRGRVIADDYFPASD